MAKVKLTAEETQHQQILAALRAALDGQPHVLCGTGGLFPKKLQEAADIAVQRGYLEKREPPPSPKKTRKAPPDHARITDKGRKLLLDEDSPKAVLEQLLPLVRDLTARVGDTPAASDPADGLRQTIREQFGQFPGDAFRAVVQAQLDKVQKALEAKVEQALAGLREELLATVAQSAPPPAAVEPVAPLLRSVQQAVERALALPAPSEPGIPTPPPSPATARQGERSPEPTSSPAPAAKRPLKPLATVLKDAYEKLCLLVEYKHERLVDLPRLYHETRKELPGLGVPEYHAELLRLWRDREVELHMLNEVREAKEPELAIRQDYALYYYLYWNES